MKAKYPKPHSNCPKHKDMFSSELPAEIMVYPPHFGPAQDLYTVVFFTAETFTPKEGAPYKSNRQTLGAENWDWLWLHFRPVVNLTCSNLFFFLQSPSLQWCRSFYLRSFTITSTRTRGCIFMGNFVLLMSSSCLEVTQFSLFITVLFRLLIISECTTWTPFGWN